MASGAFDIQEPAFAPQQQGEAMPPAPPPAGDNEARERDFVNQVRKLGRDSGAGKEALPQLVVTIVDAINTGAFDTRKKFRNSKGEEVEAAHYILEEYSNEEGRKLSHERTALGKKTAASKIQQIIKAAKQKAPDGQPEFNFRGAIARAMEARPALLAANNKARLKPAFETYVSIARTQLKKKTAVTDEDIVNAALRKAGYQNDFIKELKRMHTRLVKLLDEKTPEGLRISPDMEIYDSMTAVATALEDAVLLYEPVEEPTQAGAGEHPQAPSREGSYAGELAEHNAGVEQQIREQAANMQ